MTFKKEEVGDFLELFHQTKASIRAFPGCRHLELLQDYHEIHILTTYSLWQDEGSLNAYRRSDLFKRVWQQTKAKFEEKPVVFSLKEFIKG